MRLLLCSSPCCIPLQVRKRPCSGLVGQAMRAWFNGRVVRQAPLVCMTLFVSLQKRMTNFHLLPSRPFWSDRLPSNVPGGKRLSICNEPTPYSGTRNTSGSLNVCHAQKLCDLFRAFAQERGERDALCTPSLAVRSSILVDTAGHGRAQIGWILPPQNRMVGSHCFVLRPGEEAGPKF